MKKIIYLLMLVVLSSFVIAVPKHIYTLDDADNVVGRPTDTYDLINASDNSCATGGDGLLNEGYSCTVVASPITFSTNFWGSDTSQNRTISFWFNTTPIFGGEVVIIFRDYSSDGRIEMSMYASGSQKNYAFDTSWKLSECTGISYNEWHHLLATISPNQGGVEGFVDNVSCGLTATGNLQSTSGHYKFADTSLYDSGDNLHLDHIAIWNRTITRAEITSDYNDGSPNSYTAVDSDPPTNSTWNVTSEVVSGENRDSWNTGGEINITGNNLSFTFDSDENSNWSCRMDVEQNYTQMVAANSNYKLATTETTSHAGTLYDTITEGNHCMYCSGIDSSGNEPASGSSSSGCLNFTLTNTCNCPGINQNWVVDMSDNCSLTVCELGTGTLNFTNTTNNGLAYCNGNINTTNLGVPPNTFILYINSTCNIQVR